jgi:hypothetical protein
MARKGAGNFTVTYNSQNITAYINQADLEMAITELEATTLTSTGMDYDPGLGDFTLRLTNDWNKALDDILAPDVITPTKRTVVVTVTGDTGTATYTWTSKAFITGYPISAPASGKITGTPTLRLGGAPVRS